MADWSDLLAAVRTHANMAWVTTNERSGPLNSELWEICRKTDRRLLWHNKAGGLQALDPQTLGWTLLMPGGDNLGEVFGYVAQNYNVPFVLNVENPQLWPLERDAVLALRLLSNQLANTKKMVLLTVPKGTQVPAGLDGIVVQFDHPTPNKDELTMMIEGVLENSPSLESVEVRTNWMVPAAQALRGLTMGMAEECFFQSLELAKPKFSRANPKLFWESVLKNIKTWKQKQVTASGRLTLLGPATHQLVGWDAFLRDVVRLKKIGAFDFHPNNQTQFHPLRPDAFGITGIPGSGKSECAKVLGMILKLPVYLVDGAKLKGNGIVGDMENSMGRVLAELEQVGPCVALFDELSKIFGGSESSRHTSGGALDSALALFLTWLQERAKAAGVVVVGSMNDTNIPPELTRSGRFNVWGVGLPNDEVRAAAAKVFLEMMSKSLMDFGQPVKLASEVTPDWIGSRTVGYVPAEIQEVVRGSYSNALFRQPIGTVMSQGDVEKAIAVTSPMTKSQPQRVKMILENASKYPSVLDGSSGEQEIARPSSVPPLTIRQPPASSGQKPVVAKQRQGG